MGFEVGWGEEKLYTLEINNVEFDYIQVGFTKIHPNPDCDFWWATLPLNHDEINDEDEVIIRRDGTVVFKGIVEERTPQMSSKGVTMRVGGRHTKVKVWRNWIERNEDPKAHGFWLNYYPHKIVQFYIFPSKSDVADYHRSGWGINPADDWVVTTNPAGTYPHRVKDRYNTLGWVSGANQAAGHYVCIDLGSAKTICAIRVETRIDDNYPENYKIQYSNTSCTASLTDVVTVTNNAAHNIVHAFTPVSGRYWRIYLTDAHSSPRHWTVTNIYIYETDGTMSGISEGTLTAHAELDEGVDFTYMRRTDAIQKIVDLTETANVGWEWWVTDDGEVNMASRRGSDLSATVQFVYSVDLESDSYKMDSREKVERIKVLGKGKGNDQDVYHASAWVGSGEYEKVVVEKDLEDVAACTTRANVLLNELNTPLVQIRCVVKDDYIGGTWDVGDDITLTDSITGLSGSVRVKKVTRKYDGIETVQIECSNYRKTITSRFAKVAKALEILEKQQEEYDSLEMRQLSNDLLFNLFVVRPSFLDEFKQWNTNHFLWSIGGNNPVEPDIVNIDDSPALRIRTAVGGGTRVYTTGANWGAGVWRYATRLKLVQTADTLCLWGLCNNDVSIYAIFDWRSDTGNFRIACRNGGAVGQIILNNYPDLTDWHTYRIEWVSTSEVNFYIDELLVGTITTNIPTTAIPYTFWIEDDAAGARTMYVRAVMGHEGELT